MPLSSPPLVTWCCKSYCVISSPAVIMAEDQSSSSSDPNPCPICLSPVTQDSYLDQCFHKFCYNCIVRWSDTVARKQSHAALSLKCPLCKTENFSIIYGYDGASFQQHYVGKGFGNSEFFSEAHRYRLKCYYTEPGNLADKLHVPRYWKFRKYSQENPYLPDWLRREIQALMQEEDVDIIMHHILGVIDSSRKGWVKDSGNSPEMVRGEFRLLVSEAVRRFLTGRTERFVDELELFLASGLNIDAFDKAYTKHFGWRIPAVSENDNDEQHPTVVPYLYILDDESDES